MREAFAGATYDAQYDQKRLTSQIDRIRIVMSDGVYRTLQEIAAITGDGEASISAQIRNLRKPQHGSFLIDRRVRGDRAAGLYEYALHGQRESGRLF